MARVRLENVTMKTGTICPVFDLSLDVEDKEFIVLLGPSGSGKTTTLRLLAGLEQPDSGNIYIGDELVNQLAPYERDVAMVFQTYALYPHLSVYDNLASPLYAKKTPKAEVDKLVKDVAETLRISHLLEKKSFQLSGGEMQRVAIGRAIVRRPKVYLLDEPLTNLDVKLRVLMRAELKRLQKDLGQTMLYSTHDEVEAMTLADRIGVMHGGRVEQLGDVSSVYDRPKNIYVAGFVGSPPMNFIDCSFVEKDGTAILDAGTFTLDVSEFKDDIKRRSTSSELVVGVRPSDITVHKRESEKDSFEGTVYVQEPMGSAVILDMKVGERLLKVKVSAAFKTDVGERLWMRFDREKMHLFDKKTGEAIL